MNPRGGGGGSLCHSRLYRFRENRPQETTLNKDLRVQVTRANFHLLTGGDCYAYMISYTLNHDLFHTPNED